MTVSSELSEMMTALETVRTERGSSVDLKFLHSVLMAEAESPDDEHRALRLIREAVEEALSVPEQT